VELSRYRFRSVWTLPVSRDAVYDVVADLGAYPQWWPQVRTVERIDESTAALVCRSWLPYDLRFRASAVREDREAGILEATLTGDLEGWSRWTLTAHRAGTSLRYEQEVVTRAALLRRLAPIARPAMRLNHAVMMRACRRGLARRLAS
jgi:ribosome-associated toxin RatA of RatAB toxin-antitoxin module